MTISRRRFLILGAVTATAFAMPPFISLKAYAANLEQARWSLARTEVHAASDGYITNLQARVGNYATAGVPLVALIDTHSFYVQGYFEETKLRHIAPGKPAEVVLYSGEQRLRGELAGFNFELLRDENMFEEGHPLNKYPETRLRLFLFRKPA